MDFFKKKQKAGNDSKQLQIGKIYINVQMNCGNNGEIDHETKQEIKEYTDNKIEELKNALSRNTTMSNNNFNNGVSSLEIDVKPFFLEIIRNHLNYLTNKDTQTREILEKSSLNPLLYYHEVNDIGICFLDVNEDGKEELIVGALDSVGKFIDLYMFDYEKENVVLVARSGERWSYTICNDLLMSFVGSSSAFETETKTYRLGDEKLELILGNRVKDNFNLIDEYSVPYEPISNYLTT